VQTVLFLKKIKVIFELSTKKECQNCFNFENRRWLEVLVRRRHPVGPTATAPALMALVRKEDWLLQSLSL